MSSEEQLVVDLLQEKNLRAEIFTKEEKDKSKTPDFRVFKEDELAFFCEVKTSGETVDGYRNDPIFNRISNKIHEAVKQFDAVNPNLKYPNVLFFVNHDDICVFDDLVSVITGDLVADDGSRNDIYSKFSDGRIKEEKFRIHLFIWIDEFEGNRYYFNPSNKQHFDNLCSYFDKAPIYVR